MKYNHVSQGKKIKKLNSRAMVLDLSLKWIATEALQFRKLQLKPVHIKKILQQPQSKTREMIRKPTQ